MLADFANHCHTLRLVAGICTALLLYRNVVVLIFKEIQTAVAPVAVSIWRTGFDRYGKVR